MSKSQQPDETQHDLRGPMRELREYARDELDVPHSDVKRVAGLVEDEEVLDFLMFAEAVYEPIGDMPLDFWDTELAQEILSNQATRTAAKAVKNGDQATTAYLTGIPSYDSDISGMKAINTLCDWLLHSEQCKVIYAAALMGSGKTDFSLLLLEVIEDHYRRVQKTADVDVPTPEFATNFYAEPPDHVDAEVHEFHNYERFLEWAEKGSSDDERWFIFDEASTELTAQSGANAQDVAEVFAPFVKKMRKMGINMIVIGHDRGDVHPAIRSLASFIDKTGLKTAEIYEGIKQRKPYGHTLSISGIPETGWNFKTDDVAEWEWGDALEDETSEDDLADRDDLVSQDEWREWRNQTIAATYHGTDLSQNDVASAFGVAQSLVSTIVNEYEDMSVQPAPKTPEASAD
ncbi:hypothetical protein [Natrinema pallidum]|uniref:Uncharacterized protein n=1 Tax=Natrinema pallidum DSM 3751 TaxID=1227495 RepID=L9YI71_9EURY|nr:hypothetical protein [Natrinema pallidum]ELY73207.1 hypothetical protein C487_17435 [Natrinema pallidum DSM 3751]